MVAVAVFGGGDSCSSCFGNLLSFGYLCRAVLELLIALVIVSFGCVGGTMSVDVATKYSRHVWSRFISVDHVFRLAKLNFCFLS